MPNTTYQPLFKNRESSSDDDPIQSSLDSFEEIKIDEKIGFENSLETYAIFTTTIERSRFRELLEAEIEKNKFKELNKKLEVRMKLLEEKGVEIEKNYSVLQQREVKQQMKILHVNKKNLDLENKNKVFEVRLTFLEGWKRDNKSLVDGGKTLLIENDALEKKSHWVDSRDR